MGLGMTTLYTFLAKESRNGDKSFMRQVNRSMYGLDYNIPAHVCFSWNLASRTTLPEDPLSRGQSTVRGE